MRYPVGFSTICLFLLALTGCGGGGSDSSTGVPPPANRPPVISGVPATGIVQNFQYSFIPTASDPDGDALTFSITGMPAWATFNTGTGALAGSPGQMDLGVSPNIVISVSDGSVNASLAAFSIDVVATATGSLTVAWEAPTLNADGTALNDLAGYRIAWGTQSGVHVNMIEINSSGLTRFAVDNLAPAEYFFVIKAFDSANNESGISNEASGVVQ